MKIGSKRYISIGKNVEYLGTEFAAKLPQIHAVTGCNTTSFYMVLGKLKFLKYLNGQEKLKLLKTVGVSYKVSETAIKDIEKFV